MTKLMPRDNIVTVPPVETILRSSEFGALLTAILLAGVDSWSTAHIEDAAATAGEIIELWEDV